MKIHIFSIIGLVFLCSIPCFSQDTIVFMNGSSVVSKIEKITDTEVEYRMWNYQDGPVRVKKTEEIKLIRYGNGQQEIFNDINAQLEENEQIENLKIDIESYDKQLVVTSGSYEVLREKESAYVEFNFSNISWENETSFKSWCGADYKERIRLSQAQFVNSFNKQSKGLKLKTTREGCKYRFILKIDLLGQYYAGWGSYYMVCSGDVEVYDILQSNPPICTIRISDLYGDPDHNTNDRLRKCFDAIAYELTRLKGKSSLK